MKSLLSLIAILIAFSSFSQGGVVSNACASAPKICDGDQVPLSTGASPAPVLPPLGGTSNPTPNPNGTNDGCMVSGEANPNWYIISAESAGSLEFSFSVPGGNGYLDWIMYPIVDSMTCQNIAADTLAPIACNRNGQSEGLTGVASAANMPAAGTATNFEAPINVVFGDEYIICISNYSSQIGNLHFTNLGTASTCQNTAGINDLSLEEKILVKIVDATGRIVPDQANTLLFYIYNDGSTEKIFRVE